MPKTKKKIKRVYSVKIFKDFFEKIEEKMTNFKIFSGGPSIRAA